jgi:cytochrome c553
MGIPMGRQIARWGLAAALGIAAGGALLAQAGPNDLPKVDAASADRGRTVWVAQCIDCHGSQARGTDKGPNLVRSVLVLHDRYGSELEPFLKKGHQTQSGTPSASFTHDQVVDLANFLRQRINDTLRGSPLFVVQDILTGDATRGAAYFNGAGGCASCHSPTGDLAGIAGRMSPVDIQQRMIFPSLGGRGRGRGRGRGAAPAAPEGTARVVTVAVTPAGGATVSGALVHMDDFSVTLRDASGGVQTFRRTPDLRVVKTDPLQAHHDLLGRITDQDMHDLVAYLETLK